MSIQDVRELFNHPLGDAELRRAIAALGADPDWSLRPHEDGAERLTCVLVHRASGTEVAVAQERSLVGIWNSCIWVESGDAWPATNRSCSDGKHARVLLR